MRNIKNLAFISLLLSLVISCTKSTNVPLSTGMAHLSIRMTDAPAAFDKVNIDLQAVEITGPGGKAVTLNTDVRVYDLLELANGVTALIATGDIHAGTVSQIRLILGDNNSVTVGGTDYPLKTPSAQQSGLKLQVHYDFQPDISYAITLDFDALKSVVVQGNGNYLLKPVIKTVTSPTGAIAGSVTPVIADSTVGAKVTATFGNNIYSSTVGADGKFLITGVPAGSYDVKISNVVTPPTFIEKDMTGVIVTSGNTTDMGAIALELTGSISGSVTPVVTGTIGASVTASNGVITYPATVAADGTYSIFGLPAGNYTVKITPATTPAVFLEKTVSNVIVVSGKKTNMGPQALGGIITGSITPVSAATGATVSAKIGTTTVYPGTVKAADGTFTILGLPAGTYDVTVVTTTPPATKTISGVVVTATSTTVITPAVTIP